MATALTWYSVQTRFLLLKVGKAPDITRSTIFGLASLVTSWPTRLYEKCSQNCKIIKKNKTKIIARKEKQNSRHFYKRVIFAIKVKHFLLFCKILLVIFGHSCQKSRGLCRDHGLTEIGAPANDTWQDIIGQRQQRSRTVARKFSIGGFCVRAGGLGIVNIW